jgi:hypothetical protein
LASANHISSSFARRELYMLFAFAAKAFSIVTTSLIFNLDRTRLEISQTRSFLMPSEFYRRPRYFPTRVQYNPSANEAGTDAPPGCAPCQSEKRGEFDPRG